MIDFISSYPIFSILLFFSLQINIIGLIIWFLRSKFINNLLLQMELDKNELIIKYPYLSDLTSNLISFIASPTNESWNTLLKLLDKYGKEKNIINHDSSAQIQNDLHSVNPDKKTENNSSLPIIPSPESNYLEINQDVDIEKDETLKMLQDIDQDLNVQLDVLPQKIIEQQDQQHESFILDVNYASKN